MKKIFLTLIVVCLVSCGKESTQKEETANDTTTIAPPEVAATPPEVAATQNKDTNSNSVANATDTTASNVQGSSEGKAKDSQIVPPNGVQTQPPKALPKDAQKPKEPVVNADSPFRGYMAEYTQKVNEYIALALKAKKGDKEAARLYGPVYVELLPLQKKIEALQLSEPETRAYNTIKKRFKSVADNME